jgi:hypothetical protein
LGCFPPLYLYVHVRFFIDICIDSFVSVYFCEHFIRNLHLNPLNPIHNFQLFGYQVDMHCKLMYTQCTHLEFNIQCKLMSNSVKTLFSKGDEWFRRLNVLGKTLWIRYEISLMEIIITVYLAALYINWMYIFPYMDKYS